VAVVGRSGSGKSTLLHLAAGIDIPTKGEVWIHGSNLAALSDRDRTLLRRNKIGLVFQFFYLLSHLSVRDNVALPELVAGGKSSDFDPRVYELLDRVGLADRAEDPVQSLSGGEMQRIAICRALLRRPRLLLADEPTGNLDDANSRLVMDLMLKLASEEGSTLIYVTHSRELAALADETWRLHSGVLEVP
jgi:ABC-type lipoprotein export system ATPase subunit